MNALARIAREALVAKKYRDALAKEKAAELKQLDPERDFNEKEHNIFTPDQYIADCRARAGLPEVFEQSYMCNPAGDPSNHIVEWSVIERCRFDYEIPRVHLEHAEIIEKFGQFVPNSANRGYEIERFLLHNFNSIFTTKSKYRLGFDVAASGQGNLTAIYIDEVKGDDLGFLLMNQLSSFQKRFPRSHQDIAADYFALRKSYQGSHWIFSETPNFSNSASHCDIAWAGALASQVHAANKNTVGCAVLMEDGSVLFSDRHSPEDHRLWSDDPRIWRRVH